MAASNQLSILADSAIVGQIIGAITAIFSLLLGIIATPLVERLRFKWTQKARYHEFLTGRRVEACDKLLQMLLELCGDISPLQYGVTALKCYRTSGTKELPSEDVAYAKKVRQKLDNFWNFVTLNQIVLGPEVIDTCDNYLASIYSIRNEVDTESEYETFLSEALEKILSAFVNALSEAIKKELAGAEIEFRSTEERAEQRKDGQKKAGMLIEELKARYHQKKDQ